MKIKEEFKEIKIEELRLAVNPGDKVRLTVDTRDPNYQRGEILTVVDPDYDKLLGQTLILLTGRRGDIAVTEDMLEPL